MWRAEVDPLRYQRGRWIRSARHDLVVVDGRIQRLAVSGGSGGRGGPVIAPGFRDPHVHLLSAAATRLSIDLSGAGTIGELLDLVVRESAAGSPGEWIRAWGWDEYALRERRAPTLEEIDSVTGPRPAVLHHRTGKLAMVNTAAWRMLEPRTPPPSTPLPARSESLGRVPSLPADDMVAALAGLSRDLAAAGVVAVTDATATNSLHDVRRLGAWAADGVIRQRISAFVSADQVAAADAAGCAAGGGIAAVGVRVLGAKIIATAEGIGDQVKTARRHGWPVAVHATEPDELQAALDAIMADGPPRWGRDRIEHLGLPVPGQLDAVAAAGLAVTTNPAFLAERAAKYRESLSAVEREWLYPVRGLMARGIPVAAASDMPVTRSRPLTTITDLVHRRAGRRSDAPPFAPAERVDPDAALALVTDRAEIDGPDPATAASSGGAADADLVVLTADPRLLRADTAVIAAFVGGRMIWGPAEGGPPVGSAGRSMP